MVRVLVRLRGGVKVSRLLIIVKKIKYGYSKVKSRMEKVVDTRWSPDHVCCSFTVYCRFVVLVYLITRGF